MDYTSSSLNSLRAGGELRRGRPDRLPGQAFAAVLQARICRLLPLGSVYAVVMVGLESLLLW